MNAVQRFFTLLLLFPFATGLSAAWPTTGQAWQQKVDPWVWDTATGGETEFLVFLANQADLNGAEALSTKAARGEYVFQQLTQAADSTQKPVLDYLRRNGVTYKAYWITNAIWVKAGQEVVQSLAQRKDVAHIYANPLVKLDLPGLEATVSLNAPDTVEWNITQIHAPQVWSAGYTGQGAVVGGQDTGYQWDHPALIDSYRGWNGSTANHNYNWHDAIDVNNNSCPGNSPQPCDDNGHGTHTMGTMVGDDGAGNQVGVAPGARWIGCRNMNAGWGTPASYMECYQWFIAPTDLNDLNPRPDLAPDVINNSWSCTDGEGCKSTNPDILRATVENVRAAGILTAHSAGNAGPTCSTVSTPAAIYDASFTVGNTQMDDKIYSSSSRGPVMVDGSGRLKPDVAAPGTGIRSTYKNDSYTIMSGTSMAAPHVAGTAALLISAQPGLAGDVDALEEVITSSALHINTTETCGGTAGKIPNNVYGWGRIDAWAAYQAIQPSLSITKSASVDQILPGQVISYTLAVSYQNPFVAATGVVITDTLPSGTEFVSASGPYSLQGDTVYWNFASLAAPKSTVYVDLSVRVNIEATGSIANDQYGVKSSESSTVSGDPVITEILPYSLQIEKNAPEVAAPDSVFTYTLAVTNDHPASTGHNLVLTDTLPANVDLVSASEPFIVDESTRVITWVKSSLEPLASWTVQMAVQAPPDLNTTVTNAQYGVKSDELPARSGPPVVTEVRSLLIEKSASAGSIAIQETMTYTLNITNLHASLTHHNLVVEDVLPAETTFVQASEQGVLQGNRVRWELDELPVNTTWTVEMTVYVNPAATGTVENLSYQVTSDEVVEPIPGKPVVTPVKVFRVYLAIIAKSQ